MAPRVKMTISVDAQTARDLAAASERRSTSRSRIVEEALALWRRAQLERELREGYQAMADEDRAVAESSLPAAWELVE